MSSVKVVYRKDKLNKEGVAPIHFRIISNRKVKYIASKISVKPEQWDNAEKSVIKIQNAARINAYLTTKFGELQNGVLDVETTKKSVTQRDLKEKIYGKKPVNFFEFTKQIKEEYKTGNKLAQYEKYNTLYEKLLEYNVNTNLFLQDISPAFLHKYEQHLKDTKGNRINTIKNDMKFIRTVFNKALAQDLIESTLNPFTKYKIKSEKTQRLYLTEDELQKFEDVILPEMSKLSLHRDVFLFQCYGGGLRISDVLSMQWKQFDGTHIHIFTQKTKENISIKLPTKALEIVKKYEQIKDEYLKNNPKEKFPFIFPVYPANLNIDNTAALDIAKSRGTVLVNNNLRTIAERAKIEKKVSTHIGRHTFATLALKKGIRLEYLSKIMTHESIKTTQIYAKIINSELDKAMEVMNF
jgi:integrase